MGVSVYAPPGLGSDCTSSLWGDRHTTLYGGRRTTPQYPLFLLALSLCLCRHHSGPMGADRCVLTLTAPLWADRVVAMSSPLIPYRRLEGTWGVSVTQDQGPPYRHIDRTHRTPANRGYHLLGFPPLRFQTRISGATIPGGILC